MKNFRKKKSDIFHIFAQNRLWVIMYTPVNPFYYIKVGFKGVCVCEGWRGGG